MPRTLQPRDAPVEPVAQPVNGGVSLGCQPVHSFRESSEPEGAAGDKESSDEKRTNERRIMELRRNPPIFMTLQETADFLQVSKDTVRRWAKAGRIRQYNRGTRNPLFASAELIQSIKEAC